MKPKFAVKLLEEAELFIDSLPEKARDKIIYNLNKARMSSDKELFKKLSGEIWEFRTLYSRNYYRLFAFWDKTDNEDTVVISTHGIHKKTDKIQKSDIDKAEKIRQLYFEINKSKR